MLEFSEQALILISLRSQLKFQKLVKIRKIILPTMNV